MEDTVCGDQGVITTDTEEDTAMVTGMDTIVAMHMGPEGDMLPEKVHPTGMYIVTGPTG